MRCDFRWRAWAGLSALGCFLATGAAAGAEKPRPRTYETRLTPIAKPRPILADYPEFVEPIKEIGRFEAPVLVDEKRADLHVRAWRFSYNARGIIEMPNRLRADRTAVIMVHPWAVDDGQGWRTPEPAGVVDFCTRAKNQLAGKHTRKVVNPFLKGLRGKVAMVMYSLPGKEDSIRKKLYRSIRGKPTAKERVRGARELAAKLKGFSYKGQSLPRRLTLSEDRPVVDYFRQFPGLDAGPRYNNAGFWELPIPVTRDIDVDPEDVVIYDGDGYSVLKAFLKKKGIRHVLLTGYATDMCFCRTTAGYKNLAQDFNVFLVGDATLATFPANASPRFATNAAISFAALDHLVTQVSWVKYQKGNAARGQSPGGGVSAGKGPKGHKGPKGPKHATPHQRATVVSAGWPLLGRPWYDRLGQVPQLHGPVDAAGGQYLGVGPWGQRGDLGFVGPETDPPRAVGHVPEVHDADLVCRNQGLAVCRKSQARDRAGVPRKAAPLLAPADVPEADLVVLGGHGDGLAVRRELHPKHQAWKSTQGDPFFAGVQVQNGHRNRFIHGSSTKSTKIWWREPDRGFWGGISMQLLIGRTSRTKREGTLAGFWKPCLRKGGRQMTGPVEPGPHLGGRKAHTSINVGCGGREASPPIWASPWPLEIWRVDTKGVQEVVTREGLTGSESPAKGGETVAEVPVELLPDV
jgi:hypothetical protein